MSSFEEQMAENDCLLCNLKQTCPADNTFIYARTPILKQIVAHHLEQINIVFRFDGELIRLERDQSARAVEGLRGSLSDAERSDIRVTSERGAALMGAPTLDQYGRTVDTEWFDAALRADSFTSFFQPIVDTDTLSVFAHECLIRLFASRAYSGGEIIEAAISRGSTHLFDSYARRLSIRKAGEHHLPGTKVFINFMPSSIYDPAFCMASTLDEMSRTNLKPGDIVFEVVESEEVRDVKHLRKICDYYRKEGFGFALDDVGTGSSSLQMVCDLKPDYIKLDKSLISHVADPMYRGVVTKLAEFSEMFGFEVIAEGIETVETFQTLRGIGVRLMQGYFFAKPAATMSARLDPVCSDLKQISAWVGAGSASPVTSRSTLSLPVLSAPAVSPGS